MLRCRDKNNDSGQLFNGIWSTVDDDDAVFEDTSEAGSAHPGGCGLKRFQARTSGLTASPAGRDWIVTVREPWSFAWSLLRIVTRSIGNTKWSSWQPYYCNLYYRFGS